MASKLLRIVTLLLFVTNSRGKTLHYQAPVEQDVESPLCKMNDNGIFGAGGAEKYVIEYYYEAKHKLPASSNEAEMEEDSPAFLFAVEKAIAGFLLRTSTFRSICRTPEEQSQGDSPRIVGITIDPPDQILNDVPCNSNEVDCAVVVGMFDVFTTEPIPDLAETLKARVKEAMNRGYFDNVHSEIISLTMLDNLETVTAQQSNGQGSFRSPEVEDDGYKAIAIASASGVLLLFLVIGLFQRRRNVEKALEDDEIPARLDETSVQPDLDV